MAAGDATGDLIQAGAGDVTSGVRSDDTSDAMAMISGALDGDEIVLDGNRMRDWKAAKEYPVTAAELAAYAAATDDPRPERVAGELASPAYAFVPLTDLLFSVVDEVVGDTGAARLVHTHQDFTFAGAITAGDRLSVAARVAGLHPGPFGAVVTLDAVTSRPAGGGAPGEPVTEQRVTCLVVGAKCVNPIGEPPAEAAFGEAADERAARRRSGSSERVASIAVGADHPVRYADASGDRNPIHLDPAFARGAGFPGVIVHGMCTLALTCHAIERAYPDAGFPTSLRAEFTRPVFPGDRLSVRWDTTGPGRECRFEVVNRRRRTVMRGGRLVLSGT